MRHRTVKQTDGNKAAARQGGPDYWVWGCLSLIMLFTIVARIHLLDTPLERDEGEFAYGGQLILRGQAPFNGLYNIKLPGIYAAYALIMAVFGESTRGIHWGLLVVNAAAILLTFFLARRLVDAWAGVTAAAIYAFMSLSSSFLGFAAHATQFVALAGLGGTVVLLRGVESGRLMTLFWSGLLFGLAFILKQPGILFGVFGGLYLVYSRARFKAKGRLMAGLGLFFAGIALPYGVTCLWLWQAGVFEKFWLWTWTYARGHTLSWDVGWKRFLASMQHAIWPEILLGALSVAALVIVWLARGFSRATKVFISGFFVFSFLAVLPGLYFHEHYFIVWFPALGLVMGAAVRATRDWGKVPGWTTISVLMVLCAVFMARMGSFLLRESPDRVCLLRYGSNPFRQAVEVGKYLRMHSSAGSRIAVLSSEPEILFYAGRPSATGHIYGYDLMSKKDYALEMQLDLIREVEEARPEFVVFSSCKYSWQKSPGSPKELFAWVDRFLKDHYRLVGVADQLPDGELEYGWDENASALLSKANDSRLMVFVRRPDPPAAPQF